MTPQAILLLAAVATPAAPAPSPTAPAVPPLTAAPAQASYLPTPFDYTFIEVGYQLLDAGDGAPDREGLFTRGSFDVTDNIRLLLGYANARGATALGSSDATDYFIGVGLHDSWNDWLDVVGNFEWTRRELRGVPSGRQKGWVASVGVRALPIPAFELDASVLYRNSSENDGGAQVGLVWHWHDYIGLRLATARIGDEQRSWAGLRFSR